MKEELLKGLTEEQIAKVKACKNQQEMLSLAKKEGIELTEEQLEAVSGGCGTSSTPWPSCPNCGNKERVFGHPYQGWYYYRCHECQHEWKRPYNKY